MPNITTASGVISLASIVCTAARPGRLHGIVLQPGLPRVSTKEEEVDEIPGPGGGINRGDFEALVNQYRDKVYRLIFSIVREKAPAEELTQDVFLKIWRVLDRYDGRASVGTWVYTIARNTGLTWLRSESFRRTVPLDATGEPAAMAAEAAAVEIGDLKACIERLPADQKKVLEQYYFQDRSVEDVAASLGMASGTVKSHLFRARRALAEMLGESR